MDDMNDFGSSTHGSKCYEHLRSMVDMNKGFRCYKQLKLMDDMSYSGSWAQGFGCYKKLKVVDDMNDSISPKLKPLNAMNSS